jgi:putative hemolysin
MQSIRNIELNLKSGRAIIFFPAGEVSRLSWAGIHDKAWQAGALFFAQKYDCPIIPFYVKGRNSALFYLFSLLSKKASVFLLPWEMLKQRNNSIHILIGKVQRAGELVKEDFEMSKGILKLREMTYALK